ncbi:hypothetical protein [Phormidium sp. CCY1219]|uniref:hypothetical protein n=1 Tax=Phormidium sp. CCY1219 TaxID=2886104 RepID=UPI002D1F1402|nr:hypothetical protein [Phormidium sp. CCY1219]MEB3830898.1 hypothetical protein [Phormidium sp. CCY1219]
MSRNLFASVAIAQIPKILTLCDRNPHSPTYGCFDRNFWHYKIVDFPSGMAQEFVWPLALAHETDLPDNPFYHQSAIRDWVEAGILYAARSAHPDASCDDYFPFERAAGAAAFSLLACIESYTLLNLNNFEALKFFEHRAHWLAHHHESGQLTNHQALIVLCLERLSKLLETSTWDWAKAQRLDRVLSWQNSEGWFQEYEGCDPGYHTLTISCLASIYRLSPDERIKQALEKAVELAAEFIHPDGSFGGEYASRNTYNFFPHGFELVGQWMPQALRINDLFLQGIENGLVPCYADDHIIGHHTWNYLLAWRDFVRDRPAKAPRPPGRVFLPNAQLLIDRRSETSNGYSPEATTELYLALNKGGVFKLFRNGKLVVSDTHFSLQVLVGNQLKNAVGHLIDRYDYQLDDDEIIIQGQLGWAKQKQMTPLNLLILRVVMLTGGRFFPNLIRKLLQKMLITGKQGAPFYFIRRLRWENGHWQVNDELVAQSWKKVGSLGIGGDQTSIYVVMSRTFQRGQLQPWLDLTDEINSLSDGQPLKVERQF